MKNGVHLISLCSLLYTLNRINENIQLSDDNDEDKAEDGGIEKERKELFSY